MPVIGETLMNISRSLAGGVRGTILAGNTCLLILRPRVGTILDGVIRILFMEAGGVLLLPKEDGDLHLLPAEDGVSLFLQVDGVKILLRVDGASPFPVVDGVVVLAHQRVAGGILSRLRGVHPASLRTSPPPNLRRPHLIGPKLHLPPAFPPPHPKTAIATVTRIDSQIRIERAGVRPARLHDNNVPANQHPLR